MDVKDINMKRIKALKELEEVMAEFMNKYGTPHDYLIVKQTGAEFVTGECAISFKLRD